MKLSTLFTITAAALISCGCATAADQGDRFVADISAHAELRAPSSWKPRAPSLQPPKGSFIAMWASRGSEILLSYNALPGANGTLKLSEVGPGIAQEMAQIVGDSNVLQSRPFAVCDGHSQGWFIESRTGIGTMQLINETAYAAAPHGLLMAAYTRPGNTTEDAAAVSALHTLCERPH